MAIKTIIVSPTARPNPIMSAEKMPGLAETRTSFVSVCHGVAPKAKEPESRCLGTLESESSEILKMIGMTANPIAKLMTNALR